MSSKKHRKKIKKHFDSLKPKIKKRQEVWMCTDIGFICSSFKVNISWYDDDGFHFETLSERNGLTNAWFNVDNVEYEIFNNKKRLEEIYNISIKGYFVKDGFNGLYYHNKALIETKIDADKKGVKLVQ